jgi:hypothetical protein
MKFKLTNNIKDGYREITNFRSEDELKSFTAAHIFRSAEVIVNAKSKDVLLKDIKKYKQKLQIKNKSYCIDLNSLDFSHLQDSNSKGVLYFNLQNVANEQEAQDLEGSGEMLDIDNILEMDLPIVVENFKE